VGDRLAAHVRLVPVAQQVVRELVARLIVDVPIRVVGPTRAAVRLIVLRVGQAEVFPKTALRPSAPLPKMATLRSARTRVMVLRLRVRLVRLMGEHVRLVPGARTRVMVLRPSAPTPKMVLRLRVRRAQVGQRQVRVPVVRPIVLVPIRVDAQTHIVVPIRGVPRLVGAKRVTTSRVA